MHGLPHQPLHVILDGRLPRCSGLVSGASCGVAEVALGAVPSKTYNKCYAATIVITLTPLAVGLILTPEGRLNGVARLTAKQHFLHVL